MTDTTICNQALAKIRAAAIVSLNEATPVAETLRSHFELVRKQALSLSAWPFAIKRAVATRLTEAPAWGFAYAFQLPPDYVSIVEAIREDGATIGEERYSVEGNRILTDSETCLIRYVYHVTDPNQFTPLFVNVFAHLLAARICPAITGDIQLGLALESQVSSLIAEGSALNQNESRDDLLDYRRTSQFIAARYS